MANFLRHNDNSRQTPRGICLKGNITSKEKCHICGSRLVNDERRQGLFCESHPQVGAVKSFIVRFGQPIYKCFNNYPEAIQFLYGLRYKTVEGTFDANDYKKDAPNGFLSLSEKYLRTKSKKASFRDIKRYINLAAKHWKTKSVKDINGADIEDFLLSIPDISEKTRHNYKTQLSDFWTWLLKRGVINLSQMPNFPDIEYELGYRQIIDWETQVQILDIIKQISDKNPKIWFGIELLASYPILRPGDLLRIREGDIDTKNSTITIHNPTKRKNQFKTVRLIEEHNDLCIKLKSEYPGLPSIPFFRHVVGVKSVKPDQPFGNKLFYKYWIKACEQVGIEGVDLYAGTRHTTTTEIARRYGSENAMKASDHQTNKAFKRYCQHQDDIAFDMAVAAKKSKQKLNNIIRFTG